jgi:hypothetical protein
VRWPAINGLELLDDGSTGFKVGLLACLHSARPRMAASITALNVAAKKVTVTAFEHGELLCCCGRRCVRRWAHCRERLGASPRLRRTAGNAVRAAKICPVSNRPRPSVTTAAMRRNRFVARGLFLRARRRWTNITSSCHPCELRAGAVQRGVRHANPRAPTKAPRRSRPADEREFSTPATRPRQATVTGLALRQEYPARGCEQRNGDRRHAGLNACIPPVATSVAPSRRTMAIAVDGSRMAPNVTNAPARPA